MACSSLRYFAVDFIALFFVTNSPLRIHSFEGDCLNFFGTRLPHIRNISLKFIYSKTNCFTFCRNSYRIRSTQVRWWLVIEIVQICGEWEFTDQEGIGARGARLLSVNLTCAFEWWILAVFSYLLSALGGLRFRMKPKPWVRFSMQMHESILSSRQLQTAESEEIIISDWESICDNKYLINFEITRYGRMITIITDTHARTHQHTHTETNATDVVFLGASSLKRMQNFAASTSDSHRCIDSHRRRRHCRSRL